LSAGISPADTALSARHVNEARTPPAVVAAIIAVSALASAGLCWLVYFHAPADVTGTHLLFLPALNALLNGCAAVALCVGLACIRRGNIPAHRAAMFTAFLFSTLFLVTYVTNHALHGDMKFHGAGAVRPFYFTLLISHIGLSMIALPLILVTFFLSLSGRFPIHKKVARWTFPIWLYVAVTGVIVYAMLAAYR
jgi:putative membrane protein